MAPPPLNRSNYIVHDVIQNRAKSIPRRVKVSRQKVQISLLLPPEKVKMINHDSEDVRWRVIVEPWDWVVYDIILYFLSICKVAKLVLNQTLN